MSETTTTSPAIMAKIFINSGKHLLLTLFMLVLTIAAFVLGYGGAGAFFGIVTLILGGILYKKVQNERVRAKFGEYRINQQIKRHLYRKKRTD